MVEYVTSNRNVLTEAVYPEVKKIKYAQGMSIFS